MKAIIVSIAAMFIVACSSPPVKETIYVPVKDTIGEQENIARIIRLEHDITLYRDSLKLMRDSLGEDLFIANYKLAKIKRYTDIVNKNPKQLKFYKGWINRVLKDEE